MTEVLRESILFKSEKQIYQIDIIGHDVTDIVNRTDIIKKFILTNVDKLSMVELRSLLYKKYGLQAKIFIE